LHNKELYDIYTLTFNINVLKWRRVRWATHVERVGDKYILRFGGNIYGKELHVRSTNIGDDNIKMDLKEIIWKGVDWIHLAKKRGQW
jgi:hypothetical protein